MSMNSSSSMTRVRVAVVGAGIAGLAAANALVAARKLRVDELCVLEAQPRIGGRVHTRAFSDALPVNIEVGAAWIHGTQDNAFAALAHEHGIALKEVSARNPWLHPQSCNGFVLQHGDAQLSEEQVQATWRMYELLLAQLQQLATTADASKRKALESQSLAQLVNVLLAETDSESPLYVAVEQLEHGRTHVDFCIRLIEIWMGATADALQLDDFVETDLIGDDPGPHCIVPDGMERFVDVLSAPIRKAIRTNCCVTSITTQSTDPRVVLTCSDGHTIYADCVIVTVALGALKAGTLTFAPPLPIAKQQAIDRSQMGQYMKVLVQFRNVFWPHDATFIGQLERSCSTTSTNDADNAIAFPLVFNYYFAKGVPVLEGVLVGNRAAAIARRLSDDAIVAAFVQQLQRMYNTTAAAVEPVAQYVTRWDADPLAHGAYSCLTVESSDDDPELLRAPVGDRILFAGEATVYKYQGALQAAYLSGLASAADIV